eukprot:309645-Pelagomonas_calceolata.AAC.1
MVRHCFPVHLSGIEGICFPPKRTGPDQTGVTRNVSRFRLRAHCLKVESCRWSGGSNICDKCGCAEVQDEKH